MPGGRPSIASRLFESRMDGSGQVFSLGHCPLALIELLKKPIKVKDLPILIDLVGTFAYSAARL